MNTKMTQFCNCLLIQLYHYNLIVKQNGLHKSSQVETKKILWANEEMNTRNDHIRMSITVYQTEIESMELFFLLNSIYIVHITNACCIRARSLQARVLHT